MRTPLIAIFLLATNYSFAQNLIGPKDPCYSDNNSIPCREKISKAIFFMTSVDGKVRSSDYSYVNAYFEKFGIEGFKVKQSQYHAGSLLTYTLGQSTDKKFNYKLLNAFPKGETIDGKNIYDHVIHSRPPFRRESILKAYINNLNLLFPEKGNEDFQLTKEKFGLPWEDPNFATKYIERIQNMVHSIDEANAFFKRNEYQSEKMQFLAIIERIKKIEEIPALACAATNYEDYVQLINKYGNLINSPKVDTVGCLLNSGKLDLVQSIISNIGCENDKLPKYFDQAVALKETPESFKLSQFIFMKLSQCQLKINQVAGEKERDFLQRGSDYLNKYHQDEVTCDVQNYQGKTIQDLSKNLDQVLYVQAYQIMNQILIEKDNLKKSELIEQFVQIKNVGANLAIQNPATGKTILHMLAENADYELLGQLKTKGVLPSALGNNVKDNAGRTPMNIALQGGSLNHLKFASSLFQMATPYNQEELKNLKKEIKAFNSNDKEVNKEAKKIKKSLVDQIKDILFRQNNGYGRNDF